MQNKRPFWIIFTTVTIDLLGFGMVLPLLPVYGRSFGVSEAKMGLVLGIYSLMQFLFAPMLGRLSDRIGRRPVLCVSILGTAIGHFVLAMAGSFWILLLGRAIDGLAGSNIATAQAYIADMSPPEQRTRNIGMWFGAAFGIGFAFGPFFGGLTYHLGTWLVPSIAERVPFMVAGTMALLNALHAWRRLPESQPDRSKFHLGWRTSSFHIIGEVLRNHAGRLVIMNATVIMAFAQMESTYAYLLIDRFGFNKDNIYWLFGGLGLTVAFVQGGLIRRIEPVLGDRKLAMLGGALLGLSLLMLPLSTGTAWLVIFSLLMATGNGCISPALTGAISKKVSGTVQGETMGVSASLGSLARFAGPALGLALYQFGGATAPYLAAGVMMLVATAITSRVLTRV
jgi:MFS family permease